MKDFYLTKMPFGQYKGEQVTLLPSSYLIWIVKTYKGGFKARTAGKPDANIKRITEEVFIAAKKTLEELGYNTKGIEPVKE